MTIVSFKHHLLLDQTENLAFVGVVNNGSDKWRSRIKEEINSSMIDKPEVSLISRKPLTLKSFQSIDRFDRVVFGPYPSSVPKKEKQTLLKVDFLKF